MSQSLVKNLVHLIWSTKNRRPFITKKIKPELEKYIAGIYINMDLHVYKIGAAKDHIHSLVDISKNNALKDIVRKVKSNSSSWLKNSKINKFSWQTGYGGFSVSESKRKDVMKYIENQWNHHKKISYKDELKKFLDKHSIDYDVEYLWD
jgi:REP element-mobilizing transposase RayT